jgi:hypothetical protein
MAVLFKGVKKTREICVARADMITLGEKKLSKHT